MSALDRILEAFSGDTTVSHDEFVELLQAHAPELYRRVHVLLGRAEFVDDVAQQTMVEALASWRRYDRSRPIGPWITGIALNVARRYWRRTRHGRNAQETLAVAGGPPRSGTPEAETLSRERAQLLYEALDTLSPLLRETFLLRVVEDLPAEEVARLTRTTAGAVHTRVCRARDALRAYVDARHESEEVRR
ncbi:MAG: sigma-70 family RNA polymerase sigma factor [Deltaproteobacteria bacterium]|nr:sigma-70 family RNA polymerase sigma factor [Deltaproteobacteria bacterium]